MSKILLSWYALNNDFKNNEVLDDGPTLSFHRDFFEKQGYARHIILTSRSHEDEDMYLLKLRTSLHYKFPGHSVETKALNLNDVINLNEIRAKIEPLLISLKDHEIDVFISPGTPAMQTAWVLLHMNLGLKTRLFQVREKRFTVSKERNELIEIIIERDKYVASTVIREQGFEEQELADEYLVSNSLKELYARAFRASQASYATVLITGASGSGKEHLARYIHNNSPRSKMPFLPINCSAFSDDLLRSELFGHEKGSFTGAIAKKEGLIQSCQGGTVFLDEIGDISPFIQQSLLRVLQEKEIFPVGTTKPISVDVRFIAATNADLIDKCAKGSFRWDLLYRMAVVELVVPSLLDRGKDELAQYLTFFLKTKSNKYRKPLLKLSPELKAHILNYSFPGNLRELENLVETLYVLSEDGKAGIEMLPSRIRNPKISTSLLLEDIERRHIQYVLNLNKGNKNRSAKDLGIVINTLKKKMNKYGII